MLGENVIENAELPLAKCIFMASFQNASKESASDATTKKKSPVGIGVAAISENIIKARGCNYRSLPVNFTN